MEDNKLNINKEQITTARGCCFVQNDNELNAKVNQHNCCKLNTHNWLKSYSQSSPVQQKFVEIRFKNGRKNFYYLEEGMELKEGEIVAVEATPGHDIGIVSLTGDLVDLQMKRKNVDPENTEIKKVYRKARTSDIEKWLEAIKLEDSIMYRTRIFASDLGLDMKVNDVEYQGDKTKAIFYYTADERVDFRQLIRKLAEAFHCRIEMKQIGARQEAAKLGGIGPCGRELCCSSYMSSFSSVSTNAARIQQLSLNPQKLAGQCGKLKCCLNYETDSYIDALKEFPETKIQLKTKKGIGIHQKTDVFKKILWYSYADDYNNLMAIPLKEVKKIIKINGKGKEVPDLESYAQEQESKTVSYNGEMDEIVNYNA